MGTSSTTVLVGVLGDTHGRLDSAIVDLFDGCNHIIHAGDVGNRAILERLCSLAPLTAVCGNSDGGNLDDLPDMATVTLGGVTVLVRHDAVMVEALDAAFLETMRAAGRGVVICGHTHVPAIERRDGVLYLNPGSASMRHYEVPRSVAVLQIERGECVAEILELTRA